MTRDFEEVANLGNGILFRAKFEDPSTRISTIQHPGHLGSRVVCNQGAWRDILCCKVTHYGAHVFSIRGLE